MKALSIKQPWAWLIVNGYKNVENRTWPLPRTFEIPQRIYVHTGVSRSELNRKEVTASVLRIVSTSEGGEFMLALLRDMPLGSIVGEATITDILSPCAPNGLNEDTEDEPWYEGDPYYGFVLSNPSAYAKPIPYRGRLGFFEVELPTEPA